MLEQLQGAIQFYLNQYQLKLLNPEGLLLLLAVPVFALLGLWMGRDLRWYRRWLNQLLAVLLLCCLAVALSRPAKISTENAPAVAILADLSDSVDAQARAKMEEQIRTLWEDRGKAVSFLVGFGAQPQLLARPESRLAGLPEQFDSNATDIAAALRFCYGLFPPQYDRRIILFSDGEETRGNLLAETAIASELGIKVFTVFVPPTSASDVRLEKVLAPQLVHLGETADLEVEAVSSNAQAATLILSKDGEQVERRPLPLRQGTQRIPWKLVLDKEGWHTLSARVATRADRYVQNNWASSRVFVSGLPKVLLVQRRDEASPLRRLLESQKLQLTTTTINALPSTIQEYNEQDLLILDDLPLGKLSKEQVSLLRNYVEELGGGILVSAGPEASELADPKELPIESLLPVSFRQVKKKEEIPAALVFVLDRSSSMERNSKFVILLRAVADTLDRLRDTAQVGLVMFDDFPEGVVPLTEAKNRDQIRKILLTQRVGGGTSLYPGLEAAQQQLQKSAAKLKHVIVLSDGQSITLFDQFGYIVEKMVKERITISAVALGSDADQSELKKVAEQGGGRYYYTDSIANVPKIFTAETENITESKVVEQAIRAVPAKLVQVLSGIDFAQSPPLKGYIASEARPTSEVLLKSSDRGEPLLVRWRFGLGKVTVLTTDAQGTWSSDWTSWDGFSRLWPQLANDTVRRNPPGDLRIEATLHGETALVSVRAPAERADDQTKVPKLLAMNPRGQILQTTLVRRGLGFYQAEVPMKDLGPYSFQAERIGRRGVREVAYAALGRTYQEEYISAAGNPALLQSVAQITGADASAGTAPAFAPGRQERKAQKEYWPTFAFAAIVLFLLQILFRRL